MGYDNDIILLLLDDDLFWRNENVDSVGITPDKSSTCSGVPGTTIFDGVLGDSGDAGSNGKASVSR